MLILYFKACEISEYPLFIFLPFL